MKIEFEDVKDFFDDAFFRHEFKDDNLVEALRDKFLQEFANRIVEIKKNPEQKEALVKAINALNYKTRGSEEKNYSKLCEFFNLEWHGLRSRLLIALVEDFLKDKRKGK